MDMTLETDDLTQYAVLWEVSGSDGYGEQRVKAPIEIRCRWRIGAVLPNSPLSNTYSLRGMARVDRVLPLQAIMWQGTLEEYLKSQNPVPLYQIVDYQEVYDIKGVNVRRKVVLAAWNNRLPPGVG